MATSRVIKARLRAATAEVVAVDTATGETVALKAAPGAGKRVYVTGYSLIVDGNQRFDFKSSTTLLKSLDTSNAAVLEDRAEDGKWLFRCALNEALNRVTDAAVRVSGTVELKVIDDD